MNTVRLARASLGAAIVIDVATAADVATAHENQDISIDEAHILSQAKISMAQAITAAEQATGGKAAGIGIEDQDGIVKFEVTILKDAKRQNVLVDPQSGKVVKIRLGAE